MSPQLLIAWGYRSDEVNLPLVWPVYSFKTKNEITIDPSTKVISIRKTDRNIRRPVAGTLGIHVEGALCPHPDLIDPSTTVEGALYRFCPKIPGYDISKPAFREFVQNWLKKNLTPLAPDSDVSVESWLAKTSYTLKRKEELYRKFQNIKDKYDSKHRNVKSFVKDEFYPDYKHARAINSRSDEFKTLTGPIFQLISDELFKRPEFIKKIPVHERPDVMLRDLYQENGKYFCTDFSSFEAHFRKVIMEDCEFQLYEYMTQHLPEHDDFMKMCFDVIAGTNHIEFKNVLMQIDAKRMSGEMNTSLGNGFSNLMFLLYICSITPGCENVRAKIEGDDGVCSVTGTPPTTDAFKKFGLRVKIETYTDLCRASFCGMVFDIQEKNNVSDPRDVLATFGWTSSRYIRSKKSVHMTLLRCKALSLAYQYPSCPILSSLARRVLFLTRSHEVKNFVEKQGKFLYNQYDIDLFLIAEKRNRQGLLLFAEPGVRTRQLVEELYGIPIAEQLIVEQYFDSMQVIEPINHPVVLSWMPQQWKHYYNNYVCSVSPTSANYDYPTNLWLKIKPEFDASSYMRPSKRSTRL